MPRMLQCGVAVQGWAACGAGAHAGGRRSARRSCAPLWLSCERTPGCWLPSGRRRVGGAPPALVAASLLPPTMCMESRLRLIMARCCYLCLGGLQILKQIRGGWARAHGWFWSNSRTTHAQAARAPIAPAPGLLAHAAPAARSQLAGAVARSPSGPPGALAAPHAVLAVAAGGLVRLLLALALQAGDGGQV